MHHAKPLTENKNKTPWKNETWHKVKVVRESAKGTIDVYFDDMKKPHMSVIDKTYGKGRIGIGSFDDMNDFDNIQAVRALNRKNAPTRFPELKVG